MEEHLTPTATHMLAAFPVIRPTARFEGAVDGDTYDVLVNWFGRKHWPWRGASIVRVRLRDYGAREMTDREGEDPKQLGRLPGPDAAKMATQLLTLRPLAVEFAGLDDRGRELALMWIDMGDGWVSLGEVLSQHHVVGPTSTIGLS